MESLFESASNSKLNFSEVSIFLLSISFFSCSSILFCNTSISIFFFAGLQEILGLGFRLGSLPIPFREHHGSPDPADHAFVSLDRPQSQVVLEWSWGGVALAVSREGSCSVLERIMGCLRAVFGRLGAVLERSWSGLGASLG